MIFLLFLLSSNETTAIETIYTIISKLSENPLTVDSISYLAKTWHITSIICFAFMCTFSPWYSPSQQYTKAKMDKWYHDNSYTDLTEKENNQ